MGEFMSGLNMGEGHVFHARHGEIKNQFRYPIFYILAGCGHEEALQGLLRGKFKRALSFSAGDYLKGGKQPLEKSIKNFLETECQYVAESVQLLTMPRMLGYAFNPICFWFCYKNQKMDAVLCEVNNTFGERHFYWIHPDQGIAEDAWYKAVKVFHVSPFFPVEGYYQFRFQVSADTYRIDINYLGDDQILKLATWIEGKFRPLVESSAGYLLLKYGWMTPLVVLRIHTQALRLWLKKARFYKKPQVPKQEVTS